jgi:CDP-glycerol glycerophosphotransferase (TagB/SpsB family)
VLDGRRRADYGPPTLLYAPTWEGYYEAADYSSLERQGAALVRYVLSAHPNVRIVFKPHPMSGAVRAAAAGARDEVTRLLREAGAPHVLAVDQPDLDLLAWFDRSDVLLSDISAVVTDWLHTDKPYLVTNPRGLEVEEFHARFPSHRAAYLVHADLSGLDEGLRAAFGDDPAADERAKMKAAVLGEHPDGPMASFEHALSDVLAWAERDAERVRNTFAYE